MLFAVELPASKTKINRAGALLRDAANGKAVDSAEYRKSLDLVRAFRAIHGYPTTNVAMGLRHHARKVASGEWFDLGQRLKQLPTITDKLVRMPGTNLARMQDIGGCRATFLNQATVDAAIGSLQERDRRGTWDIVDIDDYVTGKQRLDGYRAKHVIVRKHGVQIEIQFRTVIQHNWAQLVEDLDKALGLGMKQGRAPEWAVTSVADAARDMEQYEYGQISRDDLIRTLNSSLAPLLQRARKEIQ